MDKKVEGSWLIYQAAKLQMVTNAIEFENILEAGKSGIFLSSISQDNEDIVNQQKAKALAHSAGINALEINGILANLKNQGLVDVSSTGEIAVLGVTSETCLRHTADIFQNLNPSNVEKAAIILCESASEKPQVHKEIKERLSDELHLQSSESQLLLNSSIEIGFIDKEVIDGENDLLFNGNLFRRDEVKKIQIVLGTLKKEEIEKYKEFDGILFEKACVEHDIAIKILGEKLYSKLTSIGIYDLNVVSNMHEERAYITKPAAFSKFSNAMVEDAFDLAKMFVSSLTYGMTRSSHTRGNITMIELLLKTLISGQPIGPVTAIGEDYKVLEMKGVVQVYNGSKKGRTGYMMKLLKKEVGVLALEVIKNGDISEHSLSALPSAAVNQYRGPETNRQIIRKIELQMNPSSTLDIISTLRTGGN
ncbi:hypothetical protein GH811_04685 [Acetobacterium malicum]|uniref:Uncharacterized protein n=1 Tax=Acetobacterium malicum TaxID=52692 RepID=A0ABR6YUP2_9FIRM|nr:hypothetical protein [Acetobacterium malicum]MBC3898908.1 hypothetical protein [Acetobacterium malicum]